jgi:hypothetical protein
MERAARKKGRGRETRKRKEEEIRLVIARFINSSIIDDPF